MHFFQYLQSQLSYFSRKKLQESLSCIKPAYKSIRQITLKEQFVEYRSTVSWRIISAKATRKRPFA